MHKRMRTPPAKKSMPRKHENAVYDNVPSRVRRVAEQAWSIAIRSTLRREKRVTKLAILIGDLPKVNKKGNETGKSKSVGP